jgi:hypothetical protein
VNVVYHATYADKEGLDMLKAIKDRSFVALKINFPLTSYTVEAIPNGLTPEMVAKRV